MELMTEYLPMKLEKPGKALQLLYERINKSPLDMPLSIQIVKY